MKEEDKKKTTKEFDSWIKGLDANAVNLWREAMAQIRQLYGDVWNGVRFFLTVNGIIIAAILAIFSSDWTLPMGIIIIAILAMIGLFLTLIAISILGKHRRYSVEMLLRKTFLEKELGFYDVRIHNVNLSFPWSVDEGYLDNMTAYPNTWEKEQRFRKGTISRLLWLTYRIFVAIYIAFLIVVIIGTWRGYFAY